MGEFDNIERYDHMVLVQNMIDKNILKGGVDGDNVRGYIKLTPVQVYNLTMDCAKSCGLDLKTNEPFYYIENDSRAIFIKATAGSGKTTTTVFKITKDIFLRGVHHASICVLSFSVASVKDVKLKFEEMFAKFNLVTRELGISKTNADMPNVRSLNSLTYNIINQFKGMFGLTSVLIISSEESFSLAQQVLTNYAGSNDKIEIKDQTVKSIILAHDLLNEELADYEFLADTSILADSGVSLEVMSALLREYRVKLRITEKFHHSDTAKMIVEKCYENPELMEIVGSIYSTIVIDEAQDVSKCVYELLLIMINKRNSCRIIGDDDQRIYGFKGALRHGCAQFKEGIEGLEVCKLSVNRRCSEAIIDYAKIILDNIVGRDVLDIKALNKGGKQPEICYYDDKLVVIDEIIKTLTMAPEEMKNICIGYRNNITCFYLVNKFLENGIPFKIRDDFMPGMDLLSRSLNEILAMLKNPSNMKNVANCLYKVCSVRKRTSDLGLVNEVMESKQKITAKKFKEDEVYINYLEEVVDLEDIEYFYEIPMKYFSKRGARSSAFEDMETLKELSIKVKKHHKLKDIMPEIMKLFYKNFWSFAGQQKSFPKDLEGIIIEDFSRDMSYLEFRNMRIEQENRIKRYTSKGMGVQLSTFHGLKGLEYETVHLIELEDGIVPSIRQSNNMSEEEAVEVLNDELRLFYVAVTRAKKNLYLYWSNKNLSIFDGLNKEYASKHGNSVRYLKRKEEDNLMDDMLDINSIKLDIIEAEGKEITETNLSEIVEREVKAIEDCDTDINMDLDFGFDDTCNLEVAEKKEDELINMDLDFSLDELEITLDNKPAVEVKVEAEHLQVETKHEKQLEQEPEKTLEKEPTQQLPKEPKQPLVKEHKQQVEKEEPKQQVEKVICKTDKKEELPVKKTANEPDTKQQTNPLPEYVSPVEEEVSPLYHKDEEFRGIPAGEEMQEILNMIVTRIVIERGKDNIA